MYVWGHCPAEKSFTLWHVQVFKPFLHCILLNLTCCSAFILPWTSTSVPTPFQPMHSHTMRLFPPLCLTVGWYSGPIKNAFTSWFPSIHLPIWANPINLCFIWPQYPFPVLYCPVCMILSNFEMFLPMNLFKKWMLGLDNRSKLFSLRALWLLKQRQGRKWHC